MAAVIGTSLTCPDCGKFYATISDFAEVGGTIKSIGLGLFGTCGNCGERWPINAHWRRSGNGSGYLKERVKHDK